MAEYVKMPLENVYPLDEEALLKEQGYNITDLPLLQTQPIDEAHSWIRKAVLLTATAAVKAHEELSTQNQHTGPDFWRNLIMNRIVRGVLWTIHNGNAPGTDPLGLARRKVGRYGYRNRSLECSLSSRWLEVETALYIS